MRKGGTFIVSVAGGTPTEVTLAGLTWLGLSNHLLYPLGIKSKGLLANSSGYRVTVRPVRDCGESGVGENLG